MAETTDIRKLMEQRRDELINRRQSLHTEIDQIDAERRAINAYFATLEKKPSPTPRPERKLQSAQRLPRGEVQNKVLEVVLSSPDGVASRDVITATGYGSQSVNNALQALQQQNKIVKDKGRGGKYRPAAP